MRGTPIWTGFAAALALILTGAAYGSDHSHGSDHYGSDYSYSYGHDWHSRDSLSWAIVSPDQNSTTTNLDDRESLDDMKEKYGDSFLYIRQGSERYVIQDKGLMKRAQDAAKPMQEAGRELGEAVSLQVKEAFAGYHGRHEEGELIRKQARLARQIVRRSMRGEPTDDLEREQDRVSREIEKLSDDRAHEADENVDRVTRSEKTKAATKRVQDAAHHVHEEMRSILRDAKSRNLAKRID